MRKRKIYLTTVIVTSVNVKTDEVIVGTGISCWDGENIITDIVDLNGKMLPSNVYTIEFTSDPMLGVFPETIQ